jgi:hypothetical protein
VKSCAQADQAVAAEVGKTAEGIEHHDGKRHHIIEREQAEQGIDGQLGSATAPGVRRAERIISGTVSHG